VSGLSFAMKGVLVNLLNCHGLCRTGQTIHSHPNLSEGKALVADLRKHAAEQLPTSRNDSSAAATNTQAENKPATSACIMQFNRIAGKRMLQRQGCMRSCYHLSNGTRAADGSKYWWDFSTGTEVSGDPTPSLVIPDVPEQLVLRHGLMPVPPHKVTRLRFYSW
jgi:hypothetical protein